MFCSKRGGGGTYLVEWIEGGCEGKLTAYPIRSEPEGKFGLRRKRLNARAQHRWCAGNLPCPESLEGVGRKTKGTKWASKNQMQKVVPYCLVYMHQRLDNPRRLSGDPMDPKCEPFVNI